MNTLVAVGPVVRSESGQDAKLYPRCVPVFLHRSNDLDCHLLLISAIVSSDDFAESALTEQLDD